MQCFERWANSRQWNVFHVLEDAPPAESASPAVQDFANFNWTSPTDAIAAQHASVPRIASQPTASSAGETKKVGLELVNRPAHSFSPVSLYSNHGAH